MSAGQKDVRSLANLGETASTARVLNLGYIARLSSGDREYTEKPFFKSRTLNLALILKHTLRANEKLLFQRPRRTATKIILPFDPDDLRLGGQAVLVGQQGYKSYLKSLYGLNDIRILHDSQVLKALDELPSLDPFLIREHLSRRGYKPGACYLRISQADIARMIGFANSEIESLVSAAFGSVIREGTLKLTGKILSDEIDAELEPLRLTLRLSIDEFSDGIYSWRGFLYFKWRYLQLKEELRTVLEGLNRIRPMPTRDKGLIEFLNEIRPQLARRILSAIGQIGRTLGVYDHAYNALVSGRDSSPFRKFLIDGPTLFFELGENTGVLSHISSFWTYRMEAHARSSMIPAEEYADLLSDYSDSLSALFVDDQASLAMFART